MIHTGDDEVYEDRFVCILSSLTERVSHSEGGCKKRVCVCVYNVVDESEALPHHNCLLKMVVYLRPTGTEQYVEYSQ